MPSSYIAWLSYLLLNNMSALLVHVCRLGADNLVSTPPQAPVGRKEYLERVAEGGGGGGGSTTPDRSSRSWAEEEAYYVAVSGTHVILCASGSQSS
jgi:hypothetical protein